MTVTYVFLPAIFAALAEGRGLLAFRLFFHLDFV
jgi:hypothetical protein